MNRATFIFTVVALCASACSRFEIENKPPVAVAQAVVGGVPVAKGEDIPFMGAPTGVTLDPSQSMDPDGSISNYLWLRTDQTSAQRYGLGGSAGSSGGGDPPSGPPNPTVSLNEGTHQFTLWVTDDEGYTSEPAVLDLVVKTPSPFMPDPTCMADYPNPNEECARCVCSPAAAAGTPGAGCLDLYQNCYKNADPMFAARCSAVITCAIGAKCVGSGCYMAPLCMAQIDAAGMYPAGGTLGSCSNMMLQASDNSCRGASLLGACTNYAGTPPMEIPGPCRDACR